MSEQVMGAVDVKQMSEHELTLEWDSSASNDMIADSTLALITGIDKSPASVKRWYLPLDCPFGSKLLILSSHDSSTFPRTPSRSRATAPSCGHRHRR